MSKPLFYRCENEYGDPCEFAVEGRKIPDTEVIPAMDGKPKCPGKTQSGEECGSELIPIPIAKGGSKRLLVVGGALIVLVLLAFTGFWMLGDAGNPIMKVEPAVLIFPGAGNGEASVNLQIRNEGDGELIVERIEANPPVFSTSENGIKVEPEDAGSLLVYFKSPSAEMTEGELVLYSNAQDSPTTVRLIANQDPWWVYRKIEKTSKILSSEP